jgi:hypothetical protein
MRVLALLVSLIASQALAQDKLSLPFWDASGAKYTTDAYVPEIQAKFHPSLTPTLLVVVTRTMKERNFQQQMLELKEVDAEQLQIVVAVGSASEIDKSSYWLRSEDAASLLGKANFKLFVVGTEGRVCSVRERFVKEDAISGLLTMCSSRRASLRSARG